MLNSRFLKKYRYNDTLLSLKWNMFPNGTDGAEFAEI